MPKKKEATVALDPSDLGVGAEDPNYQKPAFATPEQLAVLDKGPDERMAALLKDHKRMGAR